MDNDEKPIGQILSRRDALKLLGLGSAAFLASCAAPGTANTVAPASVATVSAGSTQAASTTGAALDCVVRPELTIGPYFVDDQLNRSDIRSEPSDNSVRGGLSLTLNINVASVGNNSCAPIEGAQVDIWHCDAEGHYSGVSDPGFDTSGQKIPARLSTHQYQRRRSVPNDLPRLVFGTHRAHSLYNSNEGGRR